jgi:hypothetical protein
VKTSLTQRVGSARPPAAFRQGMRRPGRARRSPGFSERHFGEPLDLYDVGELSDADQLVKALKESAYFRDLLDDGTLTLKVDDVARHSKYHEA